jgi:hypothetical protein
MGEAITICVECAHYDRGGDMSAYQHMCKASPTPKVLSYVTGKMVEVDEKGVFGYSKCRDVNTDGRCALYKPKGE